MSLARKYRIVPTSSPWVSEDGHLPYHCSFYYLARALVYDVACEFACAATMHRNNWRERHKNPGQTDPQAVASGHKLNLGR